MEDTLSESNIEKDFLRLDKEVNSLDKKRQKLVDMLLEEVIGKETYEIK